MWCDVRTPYLLFLSLAFYAGMRLGVPPMEIGLKTLFGASIIIFCEMLLELSSGE